MRIIKLEKHNWGKVIETTAGVLKQDGLLVFPSDTVYGLAANALSKKAVNKLLAFKDRPSGKAISIAVNSLSTLNKYVNVDTNTLPLLETLLPGPFTVVLPSKHQVVKQLEAEDGTLGVRIPNYPFVLELTAALDFPITATSANISGHGPHYSIESLLNTLSNKKKQLLDLIVNFGKLPHNPPSTVINLQPDSIQTLRRGALEFKPIKKVITQNEQQTKNLAAQLLHKYQHFLSTKALVFILKGELGAGKTIFTKGLGEALGITNIISPTFVVYYEYPVHNKLAHKLHHFDLYRIENKEDLSVLDIVKYLKPGNILVFEWGEKIGPFQHIIINEKVVCLFIQFREISNNKRELAVFQL